MNDIKRFEWIDALRGFTIVLVLIGHVPDLPSWLFKWIYSFHIPLFFVISGYLFNKEKWDSLGLINLIYSKIRSYLIPFIFLSLSIFILEITKLLIFSDIIYWEEFFKYTIDYLKWILFQIDGDFCGSLIAGLWFLPTIFISTILLFLVNKNKYIRIGFLIIGSLLIIFVKNSSLTTIPWHVDIAILGTIFMLFGELIKEFDIVSKIKNSFVVIILLFLANLSIYFNSLTDLKKHMFGNYLLIIITVLCIGIFLIYVFKKYNIKVALLTMLGKYSLIVISFNFILNKILEKATTALSYNLHWIFFVVIEVFVNVLLIFIFKFLIKKFPKLGIIVGNRV